MATAYSTSLKLALPTQGELTGTWGDTLNNQVTSMIEEAVGCLKTINTWSTNFSTLSTSDCSPSESRAAILNLTDTTSDLSGAATLICPAASKVYIVKNATGQAVTVKTASGTGVAIPNGTTGFVYCDGTNVLESLNNVTGNLVVGGNASVGGNLTVTGTTTFNGGTLTLGDANTDNIVFGGEIDSDIIPDDDDTHDLGSSSKQWKDIYIDGVAYLDSIDLNGTTITSTAAELNILDGVTSTAAELNVLDGITATAAELNILDASGSTIGSLSEISTIANDDVFLALDTSGGGLKKVARSTVVSGLATSSAISNVAEDSTPQLGGNLDLNGNDIVTTSNATLDLAPNGTGTVVVRGNTNSGAVVFNCESNSHGQTVYGQPHSAGVTNTLMLPAGANSTLVSLVSTDTLTNKTLTSPKINEEV